MAIAKGHRKNFDTLVEAVNAGRVALLECQLASTGENVAVVCAANSANQEPNGEVEFVPFTMLFNDNPYTLVNPPNPDGGFSNQEEVWDA